MARQPEQGPPESVIFGQFKGLKNTVARERLKPDELDRAVNVDIDDEGQARRRRGYAQRLSMIAHSLWTGSRFTLGVVAGELAVINQDFTTRPIMGGAGRDPVSFVEVADVVYFSSESISGKLLPDLTIAPWGAEVSAGTWLSPVVNPTATLGEVSGKLLGKPPMASAIVESSGRIYLAQDTLLWATELFLFDYVDKTRNFMQFEAKITALGGVGGGFFVGTEDGCYFLAGEFGRMQRTKVVDSPVIKGSMTKVPATTVRPEGSGANEAVVFLTNDGVYAGLDGGTVFNVTDRRVMFPAVSSAAALFRRQDGVNQYIVAADAGGTPTSAARIGDYIDAEIRRFTGD